MCKNPIQGSFVGEKVWKTVSTQLPSGGSLQYWTRILERMGNEN